MRIASYGHSLGGAVGLSMLEGVGEPRPSVRCADAGVLLRGVPTADSPRGDSPMASRPLAVGCVPMITQPSCTSTRRDARYWGRRFAARAVSVTFALVPPRGDRRGEAPRELRSSVRVVRLR